MDPIQVARERAQRVTATPLGRRLVSLYRSRLVSNAVRIAVGLLVVFFLGYGLVTNWDELGQYHWQVNYAYLVAALLFYGINFGAVLLAWHWVMSSVEAMPDLIVNARAFCYSSLTRRIPGVLWYIASRAHLYKEAGVPRSVTVLSTVLETMLLIVSGLFVYLVSLAFPTAGDMALSLGPVLVLLLLLPLAALLHPAIFNRLFRYVLSKFDYHGAFALTFGRLVLLLVVYVGAWVLAGIELLILANAVYPVPVTLLPAVIGACAASGAASLIASYLVQGMGITEVTLAVLLGAFLPLPVAIVISILFRLLLTLSDVLWALLFIWLLPRLSRRRRAGAPWDDEDAGQPPARSACR